MDHSSYGEGDPQLQDEEQQEEEQQQQQQQQEQQADGASPSPPKKRRGRPPKKSESMLLLSGETAKEASGTAPAMAATGGVKRRRRRKIVAIRHGHKRAYVRRKLQGSAAAAAASSPQREAQNASGIASAPAGMPVLVGEKVQGVVDGSFDAGYLVTIRVGDSDTLYRGVVFGPGLSVPVSRDDDIAPKVKKTSREEVPFLSSPASPPQPQSQPQPQPQPHLHPPVAPPPPPPVQPLNDPSSLYSPSPQPYLHESPSRPSSMAGLGLRFPHPGPPPPSNSPLLPPRAPVNSPGPAGYGGPPAPYRSSPLSPFGSPTSFGQNSNMPVNSPAGSFLYPPSNQQLPQRHGSYPPPLSPSPSPSSPPPRRFPYPFHVPRAEFPFAHSQYGGNAAAAGGASPHGVLPRPGP